jgi:NAD(P)-dependent dehydrogenase (short-subunit alcohol dehydrogenase family)
VADRAAVETLCASLRREQPAIDILVNNAGISNQRVFEDTGDDAWYYDLDAKLVAAVRLTRFVLPAMKARRWGRIINVVSINGKTPPAGGTPSCVSRAGGIALTKALAGEFAPYNILVNALCSGNIRTDQIERRHSASTAGISFDEHLAREASTIPLGRIGTAEEFANVALFLASDLATYVTGTAINVDGGACRAV